MAHKVLVVDDDKAIRELLAKILNRVGRFEIYTASDGYEAYEKFCRVEPDLIITDLSMPRIDGFGLCRRIRDVSAVPILVLTGLGLVTGVEAKAMCSGADAVIAKPFDVGELLAQIEVLLEKRCDCRITSFADPKSPSRCQRRVGNDLPSPEP